VPTGKQPLVADN